MTTIKLTIHPGELRERLTLQSHELVEDKKTGALKRKWKKENVVWANVQFIKTGQQRPTMHTNTPQPRAVAVVIRNQMFLSGISSVWWRYKRFILTAPPMRSACGEWASFTAVEDKNGG